MTGGNHPMTGRRICLTAAVAVALTGTSCDRERSNPLDPQGDFARKRPSTPAGLAAEPGVGVVRLSWQAVEDRDLAGYALLRSEDAAGEFAFLHGRGPSGATITTGKTSYVDSLHAFVGKTYFYRVAAVDTSGLQSEPSGFVGATVLEDKVAPEPPGSLAAIPDESEPRITLVWTPPVRDAGGGGLSGLAGYAILRGELGDGRKGRSCGHRRRGDPPVRRRRPETPDVIQLCAGRLRRGGEHELPFTDSAGRPRRECRYLPTWLRNPESVASR